MVDRKLLPIILSLLLAVVAGGLELRLGDFVLTALLLCGGAIALGVVWPRTPWLWGILAGSGVPLAHALAAWRHWLPPQENNLKASLLAFLPAVVGALGGMALRRAMAALRS